MGEGQRRIVVLLAFAVCILLLHSTAVSAGNAAKERHHSSHHRKHKSKETAPLPIDDQKDVSAPLPPPPAMVPPPPPPPPRPIFSNVNQVLNNSGPSKDEWYRFARIEMFNGFEVWNIPEGLHLYHGRCKTDKPSKQPIFFSNMQYAELYTFECPVGEGAIHEFVIKGNYRLLRLLSAPNLNRLITEGFVDEDVLRRTTGYKRINGTLPVDSDEVIWSRASSYSSDGPMTDGICDMIYSPAGAGIGGFAEASCDENASGYRRCSLTAFHSELCFCDPWRAAPTVNQPDLEYLGVAKRVNRKARTPIVLNYDPPKKKFLGLW